MVQRERKWWHGQSSPREGENGGGSSVFGGTDARSGPVVTSVRCGPLRARVPDGGGMVKMFTARCRRRPLKGAVVSWAGQCRGLAVGLGRGLAQRGQRPRAGGRGRRLCAEREAGEAGWLPGSPYYSPRWRQFDLIQIQFKLFQILTDSKRTLPSSKILK
jgi:hypothetical protein